MKLKLFFFLVFLDQLTKTLTQGVHSELLPFFAITSITNTGTAFGLFSSNNFLHLILTALLLGISLYLYKKESSLRQGLLFILAGGTGNLLDRIFRGHVLDFLDFKLWPVFNLADTFIALGVAYCLYSLYKEHREPTGFK